MKRPDLVSWPRGRGGGGREGPGFGERRLRRRRRRRRRRRGGGGGGGGLVHRWREADASSELYWERLARLQFGRP